MKNRCNLNALSNITLSLLIITGVLMYSCKKKEPENILPTCTITSPTDGESLYNNGTCTVSVSAEDEDGSVSEVRISINGVGMSSLSSFPYNYTWEIAGIDPGTYTILASAYDDDGGSTDHSIEVIIDETPMPLIDTRDNTTYSTVYIGGKLWMSENLAYDYGSSTYVYNSNVANKTPYGYLYTWNDACDVCPEGWHLPSKGEWEEAIEALGGSSVAGGYMKTTGTAYWDSPNYNASNTSGFNAYPGGKRINYGYYFIDMGQKAYFWTSSTDYLDEKHSVVLSYDTDDATFLEQYDIYALSVRCMKDY